MHSVLVAMSGGVDSSVTAYLLKKQGYRCVGATMLLRGGLCGATGPGEDPLRDARDAKAVADRLGIEHRTLDFSRQFEEEVVAEFAHAFERGLTPNPCIECNRRVKFGLLLQHALEAGCDYIATGHYARVVEEGGRFRLRRAADPSKDQTYVLHSLAQEQLARTLLPLGGLHKDEVRRIAAEQGFENAGKPESQDICFIPDGDHVAFLERYRGAAFEPGDILDEEGRVLGRHRGAAAYTIGQRKGLGVALREPVYVCAKDMRANTVTLGPASSLATAWCRVERWNWVAPEPNGPVRAAVKTQYRQREQPATVVPLPDGSVRVEFDEPQRAVTPGQSAVAYDGEDVVGGGVIVATDRVPGAR